MAPPNETEILQQIVGEQLSGVTFVMDYLQLQFNPPPIINAYTTVTVSVGGEKWTSGDDQFRNRLCGQITKIVKSVSVHPEVAIVIIFEDGSSISISLNPSDYRCPEAFEIHGRNDKIMVV